MNIPTPAVPKQFQLPFFLLGATTALAQSIAPLPPTAPAADEVVELSPFTIVAEKETGWVATETLAGSRLRTNYKDVPNQIETLTMDFMADLAVNNLEEALIYTANVENQDDFIQNTAGNAVAYPRRGGRVRGIGSGTLSRNFFQISNPTDNFNLERVTIASGPNAILFGLGSPAGIFDATPARALMRNQYGFELQYDSENSRRATFDANAVVVPKKLALRLMGLSKREYDEKQPNLDRDERLYGALTFTPFKGTTVVLQGERDHRKWNRAGRIVPTDFVTPWYIANQVAGSGYTTPKPIYDNTNLATIGTNLIFTQAGTAPVVMQDGSVPIQSWNNSVVVRSPGALPGVDQTFDATVSNYTLLDPRIFPFDVNIAGTGRGNALGGYTKTAIIEQKLAANLFLELAYNREDAYEHQLTGGSQSDSSDFRLSVDANQFIPGTTTPNPNVGKLYYQGETGGNLEFDRREDWRATLSYELDLARKLNDRGRWGRWLGHYRLSGLYTAGRATVLGQQEFDRRILDDPVITGVSLRPRTLQNWAIHDTRIPQYRHYFTDPYEPTVAAIPMTGDVSLIDSNGNPFTLYGFDSPLRTADGKRLGASQVASGSYNKTSAYILAWQGFFLPDRERQDRLVLTFGYRKDSAKSASLDAASIQQDFSGLYPVLWDTAFAPFGATQAGINRNVGVVGRPLKWLTLFYNTSTTFDLNIGRFDPFGSDIPGAGGDGKDYGVRLDVWGDRVMLRLNKYENSLGPQRASNQINVFRDTFYNLENRVLTLDPGSPAINVTDGNRRGFRAAGRPNYFIMSDYRAKGYELELDLTPIRNWNIRVNGAKSEAVESNIGGPWFAWAAARLPVWKAVVARNGELDAAGRPATWQTAPYRLNAPTGQTLEEAYNSALVGQALAFMSAADGRATDAAREARLNLITNYRFAGERLGGFNLGGAVRWRAAPTIGYGVRTNSAGTTVFDLDRVYAGERELYFDAMLGYRGRMTAFGGFRYRLQLNVRNLLDENDPIPVGALTTGVVSRLSTVAPRLIVLSFAADF